MKTVLLGGNAPHNQAWIQAVAEQLAASGHDAYAHQYAHWSNGARFIDLEHELQSLQQHKTSGNYIVLAKSVGIVLTLQGIRQGILRPKACLLFGLPLGIIQKEALPVREWLAAVECPIVFVQNSHDPAGSYRAVQSYLVQCGIPETDVVQWPGDTHDYLDYAAIMKLFSSLVATVAHS